jgi:hypothetical protein
VNLKTMLSAGALALATAVIPTAALANTPPPTKVYSNQGWTHPSIRPSAFYFGLGGAPYFSGLRWQYWRTASAHATGTLWAINQGCAPSYRCRYHPYPLRVLLTVVKRHGSVHYFYKMTTTFRHNGAWHTQVAVFKPWCSTCGPLWVGPNAWPYL